MSGRRPRAGGGSGRAGPGAERRRRALRAERARRMLVGAAIGAVVGALLAAVAFGLLGPG
ncbi:MAG: hypothetical protein ACQETV_02395 [Actinomycetota bacterium]